jgi:hypothetical protein
MVTPKTSLVCGTMVRGTGWEVVCKWCTPLYGRVPRLEFLFVVAQPRDPRGAWKLMETAPYWGAVN